MSYSLHSTSSGPEVCAVTREPATEWLSVDCSDIAVSAEVGRFRGADGVVECHVTVRLDGSAEDPLETLAEGYRRALVVAETTVESAVFRRVFCSDVLNQQGGLDKEAMDRLLGAAGACADSLIGQTPVPAAKYALWAYHVRDPAQPLEFVQECNAVSWRRDGLTHHWATGCISPAVPDSHGQTHAVLEQYNGWIESKGMTMADAVVRTWWYVQNIDADYQGLVDARREYFDTHGLTAETHYIASTGIEGAPAHVDARVGLDAYAVAGLRAEQVEFVNAYDHLGPTHDYGVTFERATAIGYADRRQVFISGTASINPAGEILHAGDVVGQFGRTLENIEALLHAAKAGLEDLASILVYLRDAADGAVVEGLLHERLSGVPYVMVEAPVCRPGWLIEIEGIAVVAADAPDLPGF